MQLVSGLASGQVVVVQDAWQLFIQDFSAYLDAVGKKISKYAYACPRRPQLEREMQPPRFTTLIRRCTAFGVNPVNVLTDPIGAARSACMFEFARLEVPSDRKPLRPPELLKEIQSRIKRELTKSAGESVSSKAAIAREFGVSTGFLNYKLPEEVAKLAIHWKACNKKAVSLGRERAVTFLMSGPVREYPSSEFPSHDHLVAAVVNRCGLGVHRARQAVGVALKKKLGDRKYKSYRKAQNLHKPKGRAT